MMEAPVCQNHTYIWISKNFFFSILFMHYYFRLFVNFHIVATVGFINTSYTVNEFDDRATLMIGVLNGTIERDIALSVSLLGGSAIGE